MTPRLSAERLAPIIAGVAGLAWIWMELAPTRTAFADTDNPSMGLSFLNADPTAWPLAGLAAGIAAVALVATVLAMRDRLASAPGDGAKPGVGVDTISVLGIMAAACLFGMGAVRMSGGPIRYVQGLDQDWGETAYLVIQFVGTQALATGGLVLLALWLGCVAWMGARRRVIPRVVALLAVLPALRLVGVLGPLGIEAEGVWLLLILAIPAAFVWLVLLGATIRRPERMTAGDMLGASPATRDDAGGRFGEASA